MQKWVAWMHSFFVKVLYISVVRVFSRQLVVELWSHLCWISHQTQCHRSSVEHGCHLITWLVPLNHMVWCSSHSCHVTLPLTSLARWRRCVLECSSPVKHWCQTHLLWSPYGIGQTIIFLPVVTSFFLLSFFFLSFFSLPNLSRCRLDVYHTSTHGVALVRI